MRRVGALLLVALLPLTFASPTSGRQHSLRKRFIRFVKRNALVNQCSPPGAGGQYPFTASPGASGSAGATGSPPAASATGGGNGTTTTSPPAGGGLPGKHGLGLQRAQDSNLFTTAKWAYSWNSNIGGPVKAGTMWIPMLWGAGSDRTATWMADAQRAIDAGATHLLSFNEPDCLYATPPCQQANLSPSDAAAAWKKWMEPFYGKAKLVSPAVTNGLNDASAPLGVLWMQAFLTACTGCHIDAFALHIYNDATKPDYYQNYLTSAVKTLGASASKPIWLTECGWSTGSDDQRIAFTKTFLPWAEQQPWLEAIAMFGAFPQTGSEMTMINNNQLTTYGQTYNSIG